MTRILLAGGGLAGCLAALALTKRQPDVELVLVEQGETLGGNHSWSFFDTDIAADDRWIVDLVDHHHWPDHEVRFPKRRRTLPIGYNSIRSESLDAAVRRALRPESLRLGRRIEAIAPTFVVLDGGERLEADAVIDSRGPGALPGFALGWQKFVGRYLRFARPHGVARPMIMDGTVEQTDGFRFVYRLPVSPTELLIEDTYYSTSPALDVPALERRIEADAMALGAGAPEILGMEQGVLPVVMGGDVAGLWSGEAVPRLGMAGGFFHPTTGYSLPDAVANAALLAAQPDLSATALHALFCNRARTLWRERRFFHLLNRMLFRAAEPGNAYRVLEHFYRLPPTTVANFYAARLTLLDKARILSGRPPVPIGRAIAALARQSA